MGKGIVPSASKYALPVLFATALIAAVFIANFVSAEPVAADQQGVTAPANGTANSANLSFLAQQYIGFYGNVTMQVRAVSGPNSLYNRTVTSGCVFVTDGDHASGVPSWPAKTSSPDTFADGNFSLTGAYITGNHYNTIITSLCGVTTVYKLNTTDDFAVGIFRDGNASTSQHFIGSNIKNIVSSNGFGLVQYEVIVPKTATYGNAGYDFYVELG